MPTIQLTAVGQQFWLVVMFASAIIQIGSSEAFGSQTVIEQAIASENPCQGLKTKVAFVTLGLNYLERIEISNLEISLNEDMLSFELSGSLACATSDKAVFPGSVRAKVDFIGVVNLAECTLSSRSVTLSEISGRYGSVAAALKGRIEASLAKEVGTLVSKNCSRI